MQGFRKEGGLHSFRQPEKFLVVLPRSDVVKQQVLRAENAADQTVQLFLQFVLSAVEVLLQIIHQTVEGHAAQAFLDGRRSGEIGHGASCRHAVSGGNQRGLQVGFQLGQNLIEPLLIVETGLQHNLLSQLRRFCEVVLQRFGLDLKGYPAFVQILCIGEQVGHRCDAARFHVDLMEQLIIGMNFRVHIAQHRLQDADIGKELLRHLLQIEQEAEIADVVGEQFMVHHRAAA